MEDSPDITYNQCSGSLFSKRDRGQSTRDLAFGIAVFFVTFGILLAHGTAFISPNFASATDDSQIADSIGQDLKYEMLSQPDSPGLDHDKVTTFFEDEPDLTDQYQLDDNLYIELITYDVDNPPTFLDPDNPDLGYSIADDGESYRASIGEEPAGITTTIDQHTTINDKQVTLSVTIWREA